MARTYGGSGPALTTHGSLDLKQEIQIQIEHDHYWSQFLSNNVAAKGLRYVPVHAFWHSAARILSHGEKGQFQYVLLQHCMVQFVFF
jgi:hypothetical protein